MHVLVKNLFTTFSDFRAIGSYTNILKCNEKADDSESDYPDKMTNRKPTTYILGELIDRKV